MPNIIGVAAALTAEARLFAEWRATPARRSLAQSPLSITVTGVGAERAQDGARSLLAAGADALVSFGFAAGLAPDLAPGTLVLPRRVLGVSGRAHGVDGRLHAGLAERLSAHTISDGMLAEVRGPLWDGAAKQALHARSGAVAADMESAAIASVAEQSHVPFLAVRAIVDGASREIPRCARGALAGDGSVRPAGLLLGVLKRPWELVALLRLARDFSAAAQALASAAAALSAAAGART
jgi:adenosylhomocysteine nucleosidase